MATNIILNKATMELAVGASSVLVAKILPKTATDIVVWTTSNSTKATVENGVVTAISTTAANAPATITATAGGVSASCAVTVIAKYEVATLAEAKKRLSIDFSTMDSDIQMRIDAATAYLCNGTGMSIDDFASATDEIKTLAKHYVLMRLYYDYYDLHTELNNARLTEIMKQLQALAVMYE